MNTKQISGATTNELTYLGEGRNGIVYLLPDGRVLKKCKSFQNCQDECNILNKVKGNKYFPMLYDFGIDYMIREYIDGTCLPDYIRKNGLSYRLALNLIYLIEEFRHLGFKRLDMRCVHIFVQDDESVRVIDPRGHYHKKVNYPRHLIRGLKELGVLDDFMFVLKTERPELFKKWRKHIPEYKHYLTIKF